MSLINDALKRAKEAQQQAPAPALSSAHLRPVEPTHSAQHTAGLLLPIVLTLVALGGLFLLWQAAQVNGSNNVANPVSRPVSPASAKPAAPSAAQVTPVSAASVAPAVQTHTVAAAASAPPAATPAISVTTNVAIMAAPAPAVPSAAAVTIASPVTNAAEVALAPTPKPARLRLQGILYSPVHPSALVNGKTVHVGDKVGEYRVLAIDHDSATLASPIQTNVLSLAD